MRRFVGPAVLFVLVVALSVRSGPVRGCGVAPPRNKPVSIASESAIIVWDEAEKRQHFIRRASFTTEAADFGFLVPTPTRPELGEAEDEAFKRLATIAAPKVVTRPRPSSGGCGLGCASGRAPSAGAGAEVEVVERKRIAGHDAVVLAATDAGALTAWLKQHDYDASPGLTEWFAPYLAKGWFITAFKIARDEKEPHRVATKAARLSFKTERPFFPYSEPRQEGPASADGTERRLLRVFFLSAKRVEGAFENKEGNWPGQTVWAGSLDKTAREEVWGLLKLPGGKAPSTVWLTEFEDHSANRKGAGDVYFSPSDDQSAKERKPHVKYVSRALPDGAMYYAVAACLVGLPLVRRWRRGGQRGPSGDNR